MRGTIAPAGKITVSRRVSQNYEQPRRDLKPAVQRIIIALMATVYCQKQVKLIYIPLPANEVTERSEARHSLTFSGAIATAVRITRFAPTAALPTQRDWNRHRHDKRE
ncbi:MAG: hypothetical protein ACTXOO_01595 [Sodalis sp. (in: enterobacteria)]